jgi:hypothetical protein
MAYHQSQVFVLDGDHAWSFLSFWKRQELSWLDVFSFLLFIAHL